MDSIIIIMMIWHFVAFRGYNSGDVEQGSIRHPILGVVRYSVYPVPDSGDAQTAGVISLMTFYAEQDSQSEEVLRAVNEARREFPGLPPEEQIFRWVRRRVRFAYDEITSMPLQTWYSDPIVEALIRPRDLIAAWPFAQGDCDDFSMLVASMLLAQGIEAAFVTVAADTADPNQFSHVYVAAYRDGKRIPIDASHGPFAGWEANDVFRRQEWPAGSKKTRNIAQAGTLIAAGFIAARFL